MNITQMPYKMRGLIHMPTVSREGRAVIPQMRFFALLSSVLSLASFSFQVSLSQLYHAARAFKRHQFFLFEVNSTLLQLLLNLTNVNKLTYIMHSN